MYSLLSSLYLLYSLYTVFRVYTGLPLYQLVHPVSTVYKEYLEIMYILAKPTVWQATPQQTPPHSKPHPDKLCPGKAEVCLILATMIVQKICVVAAAQGPFGHSTFCYEQEQQ